MSEPVLIACSHGTAVARGRSTVARLALAAGQLRPGLVIRHAFVDVQPPSVGDVVTELAGQQQPAVVVPLLLSTGYHVNVDIGRAVSSSAGWAVAGKPLGSGGSLAPVLLDRLAEAGVADDTVVVVVAAGSSDPAALRDLEVVARRLGERRSGLVGFGYASSPDGAVPTAAECVASLRDRGHREIAIASYLLAPGVFQARLTEAGADVVTEPLGLHPIVVQRVLASYDAATLTLRRA